MIQAPQAEGKPSTGASRGFAARSSACTIPAMLARLNSMALIGIDAIPCEVEAGVAVCGFGQPAIVGLPADGQ